MLLNWQLGCYFEVQLFQRQAYFSENYLKLFSSILSCTRGKLKISGKIEHTAASRLNAYGVILRFYLPPYAEFVQGSYETTDSLYPSAVVTYNTQTSQKELTLRVSNRH